MCFFLGVLVAFAAFKLTRHHRHHGPMGRFGPRAAFHRRMARKWRARAIERLGDWLDATPEQARVLGEEATGLLDQGRAMKDQVRGLRRTAADALRAESFDRGGVDAAFEAQASAAQAFQQRFADGLQRLRDVLDAEQRQELASLIERGPHRCGARC